VSLYTNHLFTYQAIIIVDVSFGIIHTTTRGFNVVLYNMVAIGVSEGTGFLTFYKFVCLFVYFMSSCITAECIVSSDISVMKFI